MTDLIKRIIEYCTGSETKEPSKSERVEKPSHKHVSEEEIDKTLEDSFPASDPPGGY